MDLRKALHAIGFQFRLDNRKLPGKPEIALLRKKTAIFVYGCFWHRRESCKVVPLPKSNTQFWMDKFERNVSRNARLIGELQAMSWDVLMAWECELGPPGKVAARAMELASPIREGAP